MAKNRSKENSRTRGNGIDENNLDNSTQCIINFNAPVSMINVIGHHPHEHHLGSDPILDHPISGVVQ